MAVASVAAAKCRKPDSPKVVVVVFHSLSGETPDQEQPLQQAQLAIHGLKERALAEVERLRRQLDGYLGMPSALEALITRSYYAATH